MINNSTKLQKQKRQILVTCALPYSNGNIHLGHLVEHIQADIWVRYLKMMGNSVRFICADDSHGTAIMLAAEKAGVPVEQWIERNRANHENDLRNFGVNFTNYHTTHSAENKKNSEKIFLSLKENGAIIQKNIEQLFDEEKELFLADRFVKGNCPRCKSEEQYGDNCEICGATYSASEMINPRSVYSGSKPILKSSTHYFLELEKFRDFLLEFLDSGALQNEVANKLKEWFKEPLHAWDITRDAPYFGFLIPEESDKYFYVWLDAPVGYISSHENWCNKTNNEAEFKQTWQKDSSTELYHFIGKDIVYFHALFWSSMLSSSNMRIPTGIFSHGFLTVNGEKMSKSRGTFIEAKHYLDHLDHELLRYYYASKLNCRVEDIDLNVNDFMNKVNGDLVGKFVNIASRCGKLLEKNCNNTLSDNIQHKDLINEFITAGDEILHNFEAREFSKAIRKINELSDKANEFVSTSTPWALAKSPETLPQMQEVCTIAINLFRIITIYLSPVMPLLCSRAFAYLNDNIIGFDDRYTLLLGKKLNTYEQLLTRITPEQIEALSTEKQV